MNWLGFSLSPQQQEVGVVRAANHPSISDPHHPNHHHHHHHQVDDLSDDQTTTLVSRLGFNYSADETDVSAGGSCFDLPSHDDDSATTTTTTTTTTNTSPAMNHLPPSFGMLHHHHPSFPADWNMKSADDGTSNSSAADQHMSMSMLMDNHHHQQQQPKLENFLGGRHSFLADQHHQHLSAGHGHGSSINNTTSAHHAYNNNNNNTPLNMSSGGSAGFNNNIGLSMIKTWLRNQPAPTPLPPAAHPHSNQQDKDKNNVTTTSTSRAQTLSLSMSTGADAGETATCPSAAAGTNNDNNYKPEETITIDQAATAIDDSQTSSGAAVEAVPKKSIDTFGQRTSIYRGVTRHRWTGRYEAHLWDNSCRREGQTRKGRQVYLGGYDKEEKAARAYDLAALKYWGTTTTTNFPMSNYEKEVDEMKHMTRQEYVASLRRKSSGFSRGASIYRGVTRHHQHGRWQARIGRVAGNKDLYLGTFSTQEEAAEAYDIAAIKFRGLNAVTNFDMNRYDVKSILESSTLPIGGAAKRLKDAEQARHYSEMTLLVDGHNRSSSLTTDNDQIMMSTSNDPYHQYQHQQLMMMRASTSDHHHNYSSSAAASGWPTLAFNQAAAAASAAAQAPVPFHGMQHYYSSVMPAYNNNSNINGHRGWCKQEQDSSCQSFYQQQQQDALHHQLLQLGGTHNFFQLPGGGLMGTSATTHDSMEHSSGSNSVMYGSTGTTNGTSTMAGGGDHMHDGYSTNMIPMATVAAANNDTGFGDVDDHDANYMNNVHGRNHLHYPPPQRAQMVKGGGAYDEDHGSNWVPTAVPTTTTPTFIFWSDK